MNTKTNTRHTKKFAAILAAVAMGATALTLSLGAAAPTSTEAAQCWDAGSSTPCDALDPNKCNAIYARYVQCGPSYGRSAFGSNVYHY